MIIKGVKCFAALILMMINNIESYNKIEIQTVEELNYVETDNVNYYAYLRIPKINLERPLYRQDDIRNDIDSNVIFVDDSDLPTKKKGNVVIAGHSGSTTVSYFKYLYKLEEGDMIYLEYDDIVYQYKINKKYFVNKTGTVDIVKDPNKKTLTLVTCYGKSKQLVIVANILKQTKK